MATPTQTNEIYRYSLGLFKAAPGAYIDALTDFVDAGNTPQEMAVVLASSPVFKGFYPADSSTSAFSAAFLTNLLGSTVSAANMTLAQNFLVDMIDNQGFSRGQVAVAAIDFIATVDANDADWGAARTQFDSQLADVKGYMLFPGTDGLSSDIQALQNVVDPSAGMTLLLDNGFDNLLGSSSADDFIAYIYDNANSFESSDMLDGGAGTDTLKADVGSSQNFAIRAITTSIENVLISAQSNSFDSAANNMNNNVQIDAERMSGVNYWESTNSRSDVIVEDVRIGDSQITKDITIAFVESDPGNVDFGVYFDQYSLRNTSSSTSILNLQVMDTASVVAGTAPLLNSPYGGFTFAADGVLVTLQSQAIDDAQTYAELATAFQDAADAEFGAGIIAVSVGSTFTVNDTTTGSLVTGNEITLVAAGSIVITTPAGSGWNASGVVPANSGLHTNFNTDATSSTALVTSTIILDDVGRGSVGGDLVVGGLSTGETSNSKGVERFEIEVRDNSTLQTINSTNNTLEEVVIVNGLTSNNGYAYVTTTTNAGNLTVNGTVGGDASLADVGAQDNGFGFSDVRLIDGSAMTGKLAFTAEIDAASKGKYLNLTDSASNPAADNVAFVYTGGANNDTMSVVIDGTVVGSTSTLTGREDFTFTLDGGAGNDSLTLDIDNFSSANWLIDQKTLDNITVIGGAGNDTIRTPGNGDAIIDAGAGNDVVLADNSGTVGAVWVINDAAPVLTNLVTAGGFVEQFLYKGKLTLTFSGDSTVGTLPGGVTSGVAAALSNGFEVTVDIPTGTNYGVTQYHVNQAIKAAVTGDAVLSKLLTVADGPADTLTIASKIDGAFDMDDLMVSISAVVPSTLTVGEQSTVLTAYKAFVSDSTAAIAAVDAANAATVVAANLVPGMDVNQVLVSTGTQSVADSDNTINMGSGSDLVVLGTGATSTDTLVFTGTGIDTTVVNFEDGTLVAAAADFLDFTAYLTDLTSPSGSSASQSRIATTLDVNGILDPNEVMVFAGANFTATDTFSGLTSAKLLAALNTTGNAPYAGIVDGTLNASNNLNATTLVGGTGHGVVLVENDDNLGEYAAFQVTWNGAGASADFTAATLLGVIDFGGTVNFAGVLI